MPEADLALNAVWEVIPYTITITNLDGTTTESTFGVEYDFANGIEIAVTDLAYVLADNLPANTDTVEYAWAEAIPETFELMNYTFTVTATTVLSLPEANALGTAQSSSNYTTEKYYVYGTIVNVANTTYGNMTIADAEGNTFYVYGVYVDGVKYGEATEKPVVGDQVKLLGVVGNYKMAPQMQNADLISYSTPDTLADVYKVAAESFNVKATASVTANTEITVLTAGKTYSDVAISWASDNACAVVSGDKITFTLPAEAVNVTLTAALTLGEVTKTVTLTVAVSAAPVAGESVLSYTFADYAAGTQYAANEEHVLDNNTTVTTTESHFTTQLRLYSSSTHDGFAIIKSAKVIKTLALNAGNKVDTLNVYGSTDGETWTLIEEVAITSTTYTDYTVEMPEGTAYTYLKLDVAGTQQVRIASFALTVKDN